MADLPKGLKARKRKDGRLDIVGTNIKGDEYVARTTEQDGVTDFDLKILDIGSPEKRDADAFVGFYRDQRDNARKAWEHQQDEGWLADAERVVHAGMHLSDSCSGIAKVTNWRQYHKNFEQWHKSLEVN